MPKLWISIRERSDRPGKWLVDVRGEAGRHPRTFDSYEEAKQFAREVERANTEGALDNARPQKPQTLGALCDAFLERKRTEGLAETTIETYRGLLAGSINQLGLSPPNSA